MGKRFSRYDFALKALRNPTSPGTAVTPPTNSALENYQKYAKGETVLNYTRTEDSKQKSIQYVGVNPFALADAAESVVRVRISERAKTAGGTEMETACKQSEATAEMLELRGFLPARAVIANEKTTVPSTQETSQITGVKYLPSKYITYTFPYGKDTTDKVESAVRKKILTAAIAKFGADAKASFKSERY